MRPLVVEMSSVPPGDSGKLRVTVSVASSRAPDKAMSQAAVSDEGGDERQRGEGPQARHHQAHGRCLRVNGTTRRPRKFGGDSD